MKTNRRNFLKTSTTVAAGTFLATPALASLGKKKSHYRISLAEWSFHKTLFAKEMTNLDFPRVTRELGLEGVEYVNLFFKDKANNEKYLAELKKISRNEGVENVLIMCDDEGMVGHPDQKERKKTVDNHKKWIDAAAFLGCHSIRVNAGSHGGYKEQQKLAADGLRMLCEFGNHSNINIVNP